jgi:hypothetical protein
MRDEETASESGKDRLLSTLRGQLFGIDPVEVTFARRGFADSDPAVVERLERVALHFVHGYHAALEDAEPASLAERLGAFEADLVGFAYEGAGMALELRDRLDPLRRDRLARFLAGPGDAHAYMVHIGAGWAWARLGPLARVSKRLRELDPVLGWLALDGYGFHEGYFHSSRTIAEGRRPRRISGAAGSVFDTGVGRSLWFVCGADPEAIAAAIQALEPARRADLWAGSALACSYAGGVSSETIERFAALAHDYPEAVAQGAAFAAKARERAGHLTDQTRLAARLLTGATAERAAAVCDESLALLAGGIGDDETGFARWRRTIGETLVATPRKIEFARLAS